MALEGLSTVKKICYGKEHMYKAIDKKVPTLVAHSSRLHNKWTCDYKEPLIPTSVAHTVCDYI